MHMVRSKTFDPNALATAMSILPARATMILPSKSGREEPAASRVIPTKSVRHARHVEVDSTIQVTAKVMAPIHSMEMIKHRKVRRPLKLTLSQQLPTRLLGKVVCASSPPPSGMRGIVRANIKRNGASTILQKTTGALQSRRRISDSLCRASELRRLLLLLHSTSSASLKCCTIAPSPSPEEATFALPSSSLSSSSSDESSSVALFSGSILNDAELDLAECLGEMRDSAALTVPLAPSPMTTWHTYRTYATHRTAPCHASIRPGVTKQKKRVHSSALEVYHTRSRNNGRPCKCAPLSHQRVHREHFDADVAAAPARSGRKITAAPTMTRWLKSALREREKEERERERESVCV